MSVNLLRSEMSAGGAYGVSGSVTLRYATEIVNGGNRTITVGCDSCFVEIDWGDGSEPERRIGNNFQHEYDAPGVYDVRISTIGASRFTPRHVTGLDIGGSGATPGVENTVEYARELIGIVNGGTWRCSSNMDYSLMNTSLEFIDASASGVFNAATSTRGLFAYTKGSNLQFYPGFDMPNSLTLRGLCLGSESIQVWPATATMGNATGRLESFRSMPNLRRFDAPSIGSLNAPLSGGPDYFFTFDNSPLAEGFPNGLTVGAAGVGCWHWFQYNTFSTTPSIAYVGGFGRDFRDVFADLPNVTAIPRESLDFRLWNSRVDFEFDCFSDCPLLESVDFSWISDFTLGGLNFRRSPNLDTFILPSDPIPSLCSRNTNIWCPTTPDVTSQILVKMAESAALLGYSVGSQNRWIRIGNSGPPPGPTPTGPPYDNPGTSGVAAPIQTWTQAAIDAKDELVARGVTVYYTSNP